MNEGVGSNLYAVSYSRSPKVGIPTASNLKSLMYRESQHQLDFNRFGIYHKSLES